MSAACRTRWLAAVVLGWVLCAAGTGCHTCPTCPPEVPCKPCLVCAHPHEGKMTTLPTYVIEPPDVIVIDAVRIIPKPPYRIEPLDTLLIQVDNTIPGAPITGLFPVQPEGRVNLGPRYGSVEVAGLTLEQAQLAIESHLLKILKNPLVTVDLGQSRALQQIRGDHLVRPDGTVILGTYGSVYVAGLSIPEAKAVIEAHLTQFLKDPEIFVDISGFNSKFFYIITDQAGAGVNINRQVFTGNETVLSAMSLGGLDGQSSIKRIWIARPSPSEMCCQQILPVNFRAIVQDADTRTNYQLLPGDRLFVHSNPLISGLTILNGFLAPIERISGFGLLVQGTLDSLRFAGSGFGFGGGFFGPGF